MKKKGYENPAIEVLSVTDELMSALSGTAGEEESGGSAKGFVFESDLNQNENKNENQKSVWNYE